MKTKLEQFTCRNLKRNKHLYVAGLSAGVDYVVCPISHARLSMIKDNYITEILGMRVQDYPVVQRTCDRRKENIKTGLKQIDPNTGLSNYETGQVKARQILNTADKNGITGYQHKGQQTRATHMSRIDNFGRNGYRRQADYRLTTILENGLSIEQNAHIKQKNTLININKTGSGGASKISKKVLCPILEYLTENAIAFYFDKTEYGIKDTDSGNYYFYDLTIPKANIAIEYQSAAWHSNPAWEISKWDNWRPPKGKIKKSSDVLAYDYNKARALYKHRKITTYYVWEDSYKSDIEGILCLLKTLNMKS